MSTIKPWKDLEKTFYRVNVGESSEDIIDNKNINPSYINFTTDGQIIFNGYNYLSNNYISQQDSTEFKSMLAYYFYDTQLYSTYPHFSEFIQEDDLYSYILNVLNRLDKHGQLTGNTEMSMSNNTLINIMEFPVLGKDYMPWYIKLNINDYLKLFDFDNTLTNILSYTEAAKNSKIINYYSGVYNPIQDVLNYLSQNLNVKVGKKITPEYNLLNINDSTDFFYRNLKWDVISTSLDNNINSINADKILNNAINKHLIDYGICDGNNFKINYNTYITPKSGLKYICYNLIDNNIIGDNNITSYDNNHIACSEYISLTDENLNLLSYVKEYHNSYTPVKQQNISLQSLNEYIKSTTQPSTLPEAIADIQKLKGIVTELLGGLQKSGIITVS